MSTVEYDIKDLLLADGTVSGIIGTRIWPNKLPQGAELEAITYTRVSGVRLKTLKGLAGLARPSFQIDCWAEKYTEVKTLANAVRAVLDGYQGTVNTIRIDRIQILNEVDDFNPELHLYRVIQDYEVFHAES